MKRVIVLFVLLMLPFFNKAQSAAEEYTKFIQLAEGLYETKDYKRSAEHYSLAFKCYGWKGTADDRYNAACSWALAGVPDSAFFQLLKIVSVLNYKDINHISNDADLITLHEDYRWQEVISKVIDNKEKAEAKLIKPLVKLLDSIDYEDQHYRIKLDEVEKKYGWESKEVKALWKTIIQKDSSNLVKVTAILDQYGWLGPDEVGYDGNTTLFLVIQHSDQATQEKYLPMMRAAVKAGKARASSLALLEDRVALGQGKRQTYGSQIGSDIETQTYYVLPLEDAENVDTRRAAVGLNPMADYVKQWNIKWDAKQYAKDLNVLEKKINRRQRAIKPKK